MYGLCTFRAERGMRHLNAKRGMRNFNARKAAHTAGCISKLTPPALYSPPLYEHSACLTADLTACQFSHATVQTLACIFLSQFLWHCCTSSAPSCGCSIVLVLVWKPNQFGVLNPERTITWSCSCHTVWANVFWNYHIYTKIKCSPYIGRCLLTLARLHFINEQQLCYCCPQLWQASVHLNQYS